MRRTLNKNINCISRPNGVLIEHNNTQVLLEFLLQEIYEPSSNKVKGYEFLSRVIEGVSVLDNEEFFHTLRTYPKRDLLQTMRPQAKCNMAS